MNTDIPVTEDFDSDGKTDLSVYRPSNGIWYRLYSLNNKFSAESFGLATDIPVSGDYDGDGFADIAQFRNGFWYILKPANSGWVKTIQSSAIMTATVEPIRLLIATDFGQSETPATEPSDELISDCQPTFWLNNSY